MIGTPHSPNVDDEITHDHEGRGPRRGFTEMQAHAVATDIGIDFASSRFDVEAFRRGMEVELEHGLKDPETDVTGDDPSITGKITWAHLKEFPDYYERLEVLERQAETSTT